MMMFRKLNEKEKEEFRQWARENYVVGEEVCSHYHPETRMECEKMNCEHVDAVGSDN